MNHVKATLLILLLITSSCTTKKSKAWEIKADQEFDNGHPQNAIEYINKAIALTPKRSILFFKRGTYYNELKEYNLALNSIDSCILFGNSLYSLNSVKAKIFLNFNQIDSALFYNNKLINLTPNSLEAYVDRGITYDQSGNFNMAIADFDKAISIDSSYWNAYYHKASSEAALNKDYSHAISHITIMISNYQPKTHIDKLFLASAYLLRSQWYGFSGDLNLACGDWKKAKELGLMGTNLALGGNCK